MSDSPSTSSVRSESSRTTSAARSRRHGPASLPVSQLDSPNLFRSCASGDCERAWREFVARFHSRLITAVRRSLLRLGMPGADAERVEDLVQEVYFRLLGGGGRPRRFLGTSEAQLMTYLQRVALSVVVDERRVALARKRRSGPHVVLQEWRLASLAGVAGLADVAGPEERLLLGEKRRAFVEICRDALGRRASPTALTIARLALLEGWTSREIAAGLGGQIGVAGVDSVIYRLRCKLSSRGIELPHRDRLADC